MKKSKILLYSLLVCTMCGCNSGSNNVSGDATGSIKNPWWETEGTVQYDGEEVVLEDVDIDLATVVAGDDIKPFREIVDQFNEEYSGKINVNVESISQDSFEKTVGQRISTNVNAPDLVMCHNKSHKNFAYNKLIQPFDEAYKAAKINYDKSNFIEGLTQLSDLGYENTQFQIPIDAQSLVIYYNKDLLKSIGKTIPTTHSELLDVCSAFASKYSSTDDYYAFSCGVTDNNYFQKYLFLTMYIQNGGELYNTKTLQAEWTSEKNLKAFKDTDKAVKDLTTNNYFNYGENMQTAEKRFFENKSLFLIDRPWAAKNTIFKGYETVNPTVDNIDNVIGGASTAGLFAMDATSKTANCIFGDSHAFIMSKTVKDINVKAAIAVFTNWYTHNTSVGAKWGESGHMSASKAILESSDYNNNAFVSNYLNGFYSTPNEFVTIGNNIHYSEIIDRLYDVATQCLTSPQNIELIVEVKQQAYNEYLELTDL